MSDYYEMYFPHTTETKIVSIFIAIAVAVTATVGIIANLLVIVAVAGDEKMRRKPTNLLLMNLVSGFRMNLTWFCEILMKY